MSWRRCLAASAVAILMLAGCASQSNPTTAQRSAPADAATRPIEPHQPRFGRERPVVAVIGHHEGAELTDFVVPYGVLAASGSAEVVSVSTGPGPIEMFPALSLDPDATTEEFDRRYPEGADYVIVPAVHHADDASMIEWIREQKRRGATLVGVCDGVIVLANAGVLDGRHATAHWYSIGRLEKRHPETVWVRDQRYVADGKVVTTTGVSASIPVSLALVEAIAGRERAEQLAADLGIEGWSPVHDSDAYGVTAGHVWTLVRNGAAFWRREEIEVEVEPGVDEVTLALAADLWARTYRARVYASAVSAEPIVTRSGLRLVPDRAEAEPGEPDRWLEAPDPTLTGTVIDRALDHIAAVYGRSTAALVALQVEHPWNPDE